MVEITSSEALREWLKDKPADFGQVIAARAALRVLPYAFVEPINVFWAHRFSLALFRATAVAWAASNFAAGDIAHSARIACGSRAARAARRAAHASNREATAHAEAGVEKGRIAHDGAEAVAMAADYAARAAYATDEVAAHVVHGTHHAGFAAQGAAYSVDNAEYGPVFRAARQAIWASISQDCDTLTSDGDSESASRRLTREALWPTTQPERLSEAWVFGAERLKKLHQGHGVLIDWGNRRAKLTQGYDVWVDWYNRRIKGYDAAFDIPGDTDRTEDKAILARLVDATEEDFWAKGATYVNTTLQRWIDEARARVAPPPATPASIPPQNQNAITFSATEDGKIRIDPSRSADMLRSDADSQDRHSEAIREARALLDRCRLSNSAARFVSGFENYLSAGGETLSDLRPSLFVQRGEKLRQEIAAYESGQQDSFLEPIADDLLIDLKGWRSAHNMAVGLDPVLMRLDTAMLGPDVKSPLIPPAELHAFVADADDAALLDEGVRAIVDEAIDLAPAIPDANDRRTVWSVESVQNLVIEAFSVALSHPVKAAVGVAVTAAVGVKIAAGVVGGSVVAAKFLIKHRNWIETRLNNMPTWQSLLNQLCDRLEDLTPFKADKDDDGV